ncbi:hypothetical protein GCM10017566_62060 [Amycolatopsis bartoniae]|uniref:Uncharacterized protein n=1 Tax=Amycolatopsis bartoniae TaxID=941986 RepID=A0A8H9J5W8_9PSEU|nr:hypothetical protein GCM10017566_62060 [Amycolatopsis bartoniae]
MRFFTSVFGLAVLGCLVLTGWALWSGGLFDGPVAREVRASSLYVAPGIDVDKTAGERILGNRRLVVILLQPGSDLRKTCDDVTNAAEGNVVLVLSPGKDEYDTYGCALLPGRDDENFGKAFVAESVIIDGINAFPDRPLDMLKVVAVNYDRLVQSDLVPDGARTVSPSLPRYLVAGAAVVAVLGGAAGIYFTARRAARLAAERQERRAAAADARSELSASAAVLAQQLIDLDARYASLPREDRLAKRYRALVADYVDLLEDPTPEGVNDLIRRCGRLNQALAASGSG